MAQIGANEYFLCVGTLYESYLHMKPDTVFHQQVSESSILTEDSR